jgi:hypothetical protein
MARPYKIDSTNTVTEDNLEFFAQPIIDYCVKNNVRPIIVAICLGALLLFCAISFAA